MLYVPYLHLTKAKRIHNKHVISLEKMLRKDYDRMYSAEENISGRESRGTWQQDTSRIKFCFVIVVPTAYDVFILI
jgi:hypothetical protein